MSAELLFVYGTLRRDAAGRQNALLGEARFAGEATVRGSLTRVGAYFALVPGSEEICGELYEIAAERWEVLDAYEGAGYRREVIDAKTSDGKSVRAWAYVLSSEGRGPSAEGAITGSRR